MSNMAYSIIVPLKKVFQDACKKLDVEPIFTTILDGPSHATRFKCSITTKDGSFPEFTGTWQLTKKTAEYDAAYIGLKFLSEEKKIKVIAFNYEELWTLKEKVDSLKMEKEEHIEKVQALEIIVANMTVELSAYAPAPKIVDLEGKTMEE